MRSAGSPRSGPAGASQAQRTPPSDADPLLGAVRAAVRAELLDLVAEGGHVRLALRSELEAALGSGCSPLRARSRRTSVPEELSPLHDSEGRAFGVSKTPSDLHSDYGPRVTHRTSAIDHFADVVEYAQRISIGEDAFAVSMDVPFARTAEALWRWLDGLEEPPRTGCLARLVTGRAFEVVVNLVIFLNCAFMVYPDGRYGARARRPRRCWWATGSFWDSTRPRWS
ncbi:unnamed protein product [Prorocentrum cordatum]|uniref:Uncharacterized protein n=1 Tax=Prorocentrum cordatum TaxID=2364126 RepID=A0ABN9WZ42_9DINO|nr:unnamed protein product [Polarella glacialis]